MKLVAWSGVGLILSWLLRSCYGSSCTSHFGKKFTLCEMLLRISPSICDTGGYCISFICDASTRPGRLDQAVSVLVSVNRAVFAGPPRTRSTRLHDGSKIQGRSTRVLRLGKRRVNCSTSRATTSGSCKKTEWEESEPKIKIGSRGRAPAETHEQPAPQRNGSASQHISASAQPTTNNMKSRTTRATNNTANTNTATTTTIHNKKQMHSHQPEQQQKQQRHHATTATTVPSSCVPERTLFRIDARACAQKKVTGSSNSLCKLF